MEVQNLFPIAVLHHKLPTELADELEQRITPLLEQLPEAGHYGDRHHCDYLETVIPIHEVAPELIEEFFKCVDIYKEMTGIYTNPSNMLHYWTQDYKESEVHDIHGHGINGISSIYWLRANEDAGYVRFYNPNPVAELVRNTDVNNPYSVGHVDIPVEKGKMILFPSYAKHKVQTLGPNAIRTAIPFNLAGD